MSGLRSAIGFLTILPIAPRCSAEDLEHFQRFQSP